MKQSWFAVLGVVEVALVAALAAAFGVRSVLTDPVALGMAVSGLLAVLAGVASTLSAGPVTVTWRQLGGGAYLAFATAWPVRAATATLAGSATVGDLIWFGAMAVGALSLAFFGWQVLVDGAHVDVTADVDRDLGW